MSQRTLAAKLDKSRNSVCNWERGICCPDVSVLKELADIFDVSVHYLNGSSNSRYTIVPVVLEDMDLTLLNTAGLNKLREYYNLLLLDNKYISYIKNSKIGS